TAASGLTRELWLIVSHRRYLPVQRSEPEREERVHGSWSVVGPPPPSSRTGFVLSPNRRVATAIHEIPTNRAREPRLPPWSAVGFYDEGLLGRLLHAVVEQLQQELLATPRVLVHLPLAPAGPHQHHGQDDQRERERDGRHRGDEQADRDRAPEQLHRAVLAAPDLLEAPLGAHGRAHADAGGRAHDRLLDLGAL